jgi:hypothetical protein
MSKLILITSVIVLSVHCAFAGESPGVPLVRDGASACSVVLSREASASERRGAEEIRAHLKLISGVSLPIVTDAEPLPTSAILVGRSRYTDELGVKADDSLGPDGFIIKTVGNHVVIVGSRVRGTMYGCTELLEKLGVRWYTPKVTVTPKQQAITFPTLDERQVPAFEYREAFFTEAFNRDWAARMRFNGNSENLDESTGGKIKYHPFVHSFDMLIPPPLYKTHPEYFPLIKGQRMDGYRQRCLSNSEVLKLTIEKVRQWMKERPDATIYSVSQNDCYEFCECDNCKAIEAKYGGAHSGLYLWFVNQVAEAIEKENPGKLIDTLAYQFTEEPPKGIVPRKNVRVRLCPISVCEAHPYEKCSHKASVAFVKNLAEWAKITDTLYIWHYNTNFANYLMPFPDFEEFPADLKLYQRSGVKGIFFQGAYGPGGGGSDAELRSYVMAKLLWNPARDSDALVNEWMENVYGSAKGPMRKWFDLLHEKARDPNRHFFIFDPPAVHYMSAEVLVEGDKLFDEAERLAEGNATAKEYVAKARLGLRYVKLARKPTDGPEFTSFMADVRKFGIGQLREGQSVDAWEKDYLNRVPKPKP